VLLKPQVAFIEVASKRKCFKEFGKEMGVEDE
jgi:hypothetical protein